jgi:hypothetical protein
MYEYLGQYYLSLNEMLEDIRYDYLNMHLTGI